jgi:cysteine desulfurase
VLHTDAVQAFAWLDVASLTAPAHLVSVAAHKFGGPKGVGALAVRAGVPLEPLMRGGGQERDRRSGTHNVAGIVGMAAAMQATVAARGLAAPRVASMRARLADHIGAAVPGVVETGGPDNRHRRLPSICHLRLAGVESEALLVLLDEGGLCASAGSACASGAMEPSHVLAAMGVNRESALSSLRLSLGWPTTEADVDMATSVIVDAVARLRSDRTAGVSA